MRYIIAFWLCLIGYVVWSYGLVDPNLVFTSWQPYWVFQNWIWSFARSFPGWYTALYTLLILSLFWFATKISLWLKRVNNLAKGKIIFYFFLLVSPLLFSYNALSHDVFNYLFNARMVVVYHSNPHLHTALEFASDDWTRFMHNTHTTAPYGYGWTTLSLLPYLAGMGKFTWSWLVFRLFSALSLLLVFVALKQLASRLGKKLSLDKLAIFFLNPLVLIEILANSHNDLWMMAPALFGLSVLLNRQKYTFTVRMVFSLFLLILSISIKYVTVVLLPIWVVLILLERWEVISFERIRSRLPIPQRLLSLFTQGIWQRLLRIIPHSAAVLLLLPLLTNQSQQYLPWYLTWSLVWLPLIAARRWRQFWFVLSLTAMLRYLPWLLAGGYEIHTLDWQKLISLAIPALWLFWFSLKKRDSLVREHILIGKTVDE